MDVDAELDPLDAFMGDVVQQVQIESGPRSTPQYPSSTHRVLKSRPLKPTEYS